MDQMTIDKKTFIVGLDWHEVSEGNPRSYRRLTRLIEKKGDPLRGVAVIEDVEGATHVGLFRDPKGVPKKALSLAGSVARRHPDGVFIARVDDDRVWMTIINQGAVIPGTDVCRSPEEVNRELRKAVDLFEDLPIVVNEPGLIISQLDDEIEPHPGIEQWDIVAREIPMHEWVTEGEEVEIEALEDTRAKNQKLALLVGVVMLVGGGGYYAWEATQTEPPPPRPPGGEGEPSMSEEEKARQEYLDGLVRDLRNRLPASSRWATRSVDRVLDENAVSTMGWAFEGVICTPGQCTVSWVPYSDYRPVQGFHEYVNVESGRISRNQRGDNLTASVAQASVAMTSVPESELESLPSGETVREDWWDFKQAMRMRFPGVEFDRREQTRRLGPSPVPVGVPRIEEGTLNVEGQGLVQMEAFVEYLEKTPMRVTKLTYSPGSSTMDQPKWRATMKYLAQQ